MGSSPEGPRRHHRQALLLRQLEHLLLCLLGIFRQFGRPRPLLPQAGVRPDPRPGREEWKSEAELWGEAGGRGEAVREVGKRKLGVRILALLLALCVTLGKSLSLLASVTCLPSGVLTLDARSV